MDEFEPYLRGWRERWEREHEKDRHCAEAALEVARGLAAALGNEYGASRVVLVGSLARGEFIEGSDIDLVVEGVRDEDFFRAGADIEARARGIRVDLIPLRSATRAFLESLEGEGIVLHGG